MKIGGIITLFYYYCVYLLRAHFPILLFARAFIIVLYSALDANFLLTVTILFSSLPIY